MAKDDRNYSKKEWDGKGTRRRGGQSNRDEDGEFNQIISPRGSPRGTGGTETASSSTSRFSVRHGFNWKYCPWSLRRLGPRCWGWQTHWQRTFRNIKRTNVANVRNMIEARRWREGVCVCGVCMSHPCPAPSHPSTRIDWLYRVCPFSPTLSVVSIFNLNPLPCVQWYDWHILFGILSGCHCQQIKWTFGCISACTLPPSPSRTLSLPPSVTLNPFSRSVNQISIFVA